MKALVLLAAAGLVLLFAGAVVGADEPRPAALRALTPQALVTRWLRADAKARPALEVELRRRGPAALPALRAVGADATLGQRAGAGRMRAHIRADWGRRHVPAGMVYVPTGPLEVPRTSAPWGPSGTRCVVGAFYIDRTEVTVAAWRAWRTQLAKEGPEGMRTLRSLWTPPEELPGTLPAVRVRWNDAQQFATEARGGRLPRADEFERALRGSGLATWPWGTQVRTEHANLQGLGPQKVEPVGSHPAGASAFGVLDLVGNVAEWSATEVTQGRSGRYLLVLGGSFRDAPSPALTWRGQDRMQARPGPQERHDWVGFRVVRDVPPLPQ